MADIKCFCVNMMRENTYVVSDGTGECVIIDCGCRGEEEKEALAGYIAANGLKPVRLLCTHFHLDHIFGNQFVLETYGLRAEIGPADRILSEMQHYQAVAFGLGEEDAQAPEPLLTLEDGSLVTFGETELAVLATPGHSPGGVSFYSAKDCVVFTGDTLMRDAYGAVNLPGGRLSKIHKSITERLFALPDDTRVLPGHGEETTIGAEKETNPILKADVTKKSVRRSAD